MHNQASLLENEIHKLQWGFNIQTDHIISARHPDLIIIKKRTFRIVDFAVSADQCVKLKENEKKNKYLERARELKITVEHESDVYTNCNWCSWYRRRIIKGTGGHWK